MSLDLPANEEKEEQAYEKNERSLEEIKVHIVGAKDQQRIVNKPIIPQSDFCNIPGIWAQVVFVL